MSCEDESFKQLQRKTKKRNHVQSRKNLARNLSSKPYAQYLIPLLFLESLTDEEAESLLKEFSNLLDLICKIDALPDSSAVNSYEPLQLKQLAHSLKGLTISTSNEILLRDFTALLSEPFAQSLPEESKQFNMRTYFTLKSKAYLAHISEHIDSLRTQTQTFKQRMRPRLLGPSKVQQSLFALQQYTLSLESWFSMLTDKLIKLEEAVRSKNASLPLFTNLTERPTFNNNTTSRSFNLSGSAFRHLTNSARRIVETPLPSKRARGFSGSTTPKANFEPPKSPFLFSVPETVITKRGKLVYKKSPSPTPTMKSTQSFRSTSPLSLSRNVSVVTNQSGKKVPTKNSLNLQRNTSTGTNTSSISKASKKNMEVQTNNQGIPPEAWAEFVKSYKSKSKTPSPNYPSRTLLNNVSNNSTELHNSLLPPSATFSPIPGPGTLPGSVPSNRRTRKQRKDRRT